MATTTVNSLQTTMPTFQIAVECLSLGQDLAFSISYYIKMPSEKTSQEFDFCDKQKLDINLLSANFCRQFFLVA